MESHVEKIKLDPFLTSKQKYTPNGSQNWNEVNKILQGTLPSDGWAEMKTISEPTFSRIMNSVFPVIKVEIIIDSILPPPFMRFNSSKVITDTPY